jgi:hypothetical protein
VAVLSRTDKRYNFKASNASKDQAPVWGILDGFFRCEQRYDDGAAGATYYWLQSIPVRGPIYQRFPAYLFNNFTYIGSRGYTNRIIVFESINEGGEGDSTPVDGWATSSYEKNARAF